MKRHSEAPIQIEVSVTLKGSFSEKFTYPSPVVLANVKATNRFIGQ